MFAHIDRCCVAADNAVVDAIRAIDRGAVGIALVVGEDRQLVGIMTDGDIRRALLKGAPASFCMV